MAKWYLRDRGQVCGPFSTDEILEMRDAGKIGEYHEVSADMRTWKAIEDVPTLARDPGRQQRGRRPEPPPEQTTRRPRPAGRAREPEPEYEAPAGAPAGGNRTLLLIIGGVVGLVLVGGGAVVGILALRSKPAAVEKPGDDGSETANRELSLPALVEKCEPSVARVRNRTGTGSGFLLRPGIVVTNSHVVSGDLTEFIEVTFPSARENRERKYTAQLLYEDRKRDLAILKVATSAAPLTLTTQDIKKGETVYVIGSPGAGAGVSSNATNRGVLSNNDLSLGDMQYYQTDAPINGGNSGGPLFNGRGEVIGVAVATLRGKQGMHLAIPWRDVQAALDKATRASQADQDRAAAEHNLAEVTERLLLISAAYYFALDHLQDRLNDAAKRSSDLSATLRAAKAELSGPLEADRRLIFNPVGDAFADALSSRDLPESRRSDREIQSLLDLYLEMKGTFEAPPSTLEQFSKNRKDYQSRFNASTQKVRLKLGIDPKDRYAESKTLTALGVFK